MQRISCVFEINENVEHARNALHSSSTTSSTTPSTIAVFNDNDDREEYAVDGHEHHEHREHKVKIIFKADVRKESHRGAAARRAIKKYMSMHGEDEKCEVNATGDIDSDGVDEVEGSEDVITVTSIQCSKVPGDLDINTARNDYCGQSCEESVGVIAASSDNTCELPSRSPLPNVNADDENVVSRADSTENDSLIHGAMATLARFVVKNGPKFEVQVKRREEQNPLFAFLLPSHPLHDVYQKLLIDHQIKHCQDLIADRARSANPSSHLFVFTPNVKLRSKTVQTQY